MTNKQSKSVPERMPDHAHPHYFRLKARHWRVGLFGLLLIALTGSAVSYYLRSTVDLNNVEYIVERVGSHIAIPTNEMPALVTVTDSSKLSTPFLKQTENDDKVLIYQKNKKAIIYRPSIDRIIDIGPVSIDALPISEE